MKKTNPKLICIVGPTAVGKSALALNLAQKFGGEIINADSRQIYRELNIGTAKPKPDELSLVPHHLINCASITESWSVATFIRAAEKCIAEIQSRDAVPILVGGTGMYVKKLLFGLDEVPAVEESVRQILKSDLAEKGLEHLFDELKIVDSESAVRLSPNDTQRIMRALEVYRQTGKVLSSFWQSENVSSPYDYLKIGIQAERQELYSRIDARVVTMIKEGLKNEVVELVKQFENNDVLTKTIGYAEWLKLGFDDETKVVEEIQRNSRRFAKRQLTWFGNEKDVEWFEMVGVNMVLSRVEKFLQIL